MHRAWRRAAVVLSLLFSLSVGLLGQTGGGTGGGGTGGSTGGTGGSTGGTSGGTGSIPRTTSPTTQRQQQREQMPIFLSGNVLLADGTPAPSQVSIEMVCNGRPRKVAYTDSHGSFGFQVGRNFGVLPDASTPGSGWSTPGVGDFANQNTGFPDSMPNSFSQEQPLMGCELRAALGGHRSSTIDVSLHRSLDSPDVGTLVLESVEKVQGTMVSASEHQAPKEARKAYEKGVELVKKSKFDDARQQLEAAVLAYPRHASAWFQLGLVHQQQNRSEEARNAYQQSLTADPRFVRPYVQLALMAVIDAKWPEAVDFSNKALELDPLDFPSAYFYNAVANYNLGQLEAAEKSARKVQRLDPQHRFPTVYLLLGSILASRKDYAGAADRMRAYLQYAPNAQNAPAVRQQLEKLEKISAPAAATQPAAPQQK